MTPIKFIDIQSENAKVENEVSNAVNSVIADGDFINGRAVTEFESSLSEYLNVKHVIGVGNGTDALRLGLWALGLKVGDEVIVPAFTYIATIEAIVSIGLVPVLVDIDAKTFTIDPFLIERSITKKTKVILPVHIYGNPADMNSILQISKKYGLKVIEDTAQAIGASIKVNKKGKKVSTFGDLGCFSFYPAKNLGAFGDAGAIVTNNDQLAHRIRMITNHGQAKKYVHQIIGTNSRLDSIQAAILNVKLKNLDTQNQKRIEVAKFYNQKFVNFDYLDIPECNVNSVHVYHQYTIRTVNEKRNLLKLYLAEKGIPTRLYYPIPVYKQKALVGKFKMPFEFKNSEMVQGTMLSLPMHPHLEYEQIAFIANAISSFDW